MVTKTQLYALDLSSFTTTLSELDSSLHTSQEKLDDIAHSKDLVAQTMQGQSADALLARLQAIEDQINAHIVEIQQLQTVLTTYRTNKTRLQGDVIGQVEKIELDGFVVTDTWGVRPIRNRLFFASPKDIGRLFIQATQYRDSLVPLVSAFEQYDLQAAITAGPGTTPYTTSGGYSTVEPDRTQKWDEDFVWGSKKGQATPNDYLLWEAGQSGLGGVYGLGMTDAARCYAHFRDNTGTPMTVDYERAYKEDAGIRNHVNGLSRPNRRHPPLPRQQSRRDRRLSGDSELEVGTRRPQHLHRDERSGRRGYDYRDRHRSCAGQVELQQRRARYCYRPRR